MPDLYPSPNITDPVSVVRYANDNMCIYRDGIASCGFLGLFILSALFVVIFVGTKSKVTPIKSFTVACFLCFLLSVPMLPLGLASDWIVMLFLSLTVIGVFVLYIQDR